MPSIPRQALVLIAAAATATVTSLPSIRAASAETWPTKAIRVIVPFGAGSATDIIPRIVLEQVSVQLKQPIVIENKPGAGSTLGTATVAKSDPDGYTLLASSSAFSVAPAIYDSLTYDPLKDFAGIAIVGGLPNVLIVGASAPYDTVAAFVAAAKAKPGSFNFASVGVGSAVHVSAERFRLSAGYAAAHVPFKSGAEALTEIVAGRIEYYFCPSNTALPFIKDGKVKALAVGTPQRIAVLPDVPTTLEAGFKDSDYSPWVGMLAPAKTPREIIERLHKEITTALATPSVRDRLVPNGIEAISISPQDMDKQIAAEIKASAVLAKTLSLKGT